MNDYTDPGFAARQNKYAALMEGQASISIDYLASATCQPYKTVVEDLQKLVLQGFFGKYAYVNYLTRTLVLRESASEREQSFRAVQEQVRHTVKEATNQFQHTAQEVAHDVHQAVRQVQSMYQSGKMQPKPPAAKPNKPAASKPVKQQNTSKSTGNTWLLIAAIAALFIGFCFLCSALDEIAYAVSTAAAASPFLLLLKPAIFFAIGGVLLRYRTQNRKRLHRLQRYQAVLDGKDYLSLTILSETAGIPRSTMLKDLDYLLEKKLLSADAYLDLHNDYLILKRGVTLPDLQHETATDNSVGNQYSSILTEIRKLNDDILDPTVSERITQMEGITAKIFKIVEEKPEKQPQIKSFMSYYLPTTLKLLHAYSAFEKQGVAGQNIEQAKQNIERILDTLIKGYAKQLDQLFQNEAINISADIDVLETMMKRDGLSDDGLLRPTGGQ